MKALYIVSCALGLSLSAMASATSSEECPAVWEGLARDFVKADATLSSQLDADSLTFCGSHDLDPGSWNLRRETSFCNEKGDVLVLYTFGDLWCDGEVVEGLKSLTLAAESAAK